MGKKTGEKKATLAEFFIQFQIEVKHQEIEEFKKEVKELEAKNQNLVQLRDELQEKQQGHLRVLHKEGKEQEKNLEENEVSNKKKVEQAVQKNVELSRILEEELTELHRQLTRAKAQVAELQMQRQAWHLYKNFESVEQQRQIQKLQSEFDTMQKNFQAMSEMIESTLKADLCKIEKNTIALVAGEKEQASETAIKQVDKNSLLEITKNDWLKKEIVNYLEEVSVLDADVRSLEEENLEHVKQLSEHRLNYSQTSSRNTFMTQDEGLERKLCLPERAAAFGRKQHQQSEELEEDEMDHSCKPSSTTHHGSTLLYGSQSNLEEPLHPGPLEHSRLTVVGRAMPRYPFPSDSENLDTLTHLVMPQAQEGTLTMKMICNKFQ